MFGHDFLGAARYRRVAAQNLPIGYAFGVMHRVFESPEGKLLSGVPATKLAIERGCRTVRVHLGWKDNHQYNTTTDFVELEKRAAEWRPIVIANPSVKWYFSGGCEHNWKSAAAHRAAEIVLRALPGIIYVNNPCKEGAYQGDFIFGADIVNEIHGDSAKKPGGRYIWSADGDPCVDIDIEAAKKAYADAEIFFFWDARYNGLWEVSTDPKKPNPKRKDRTGWPDRELIDSITVQSGARGACNIPAGDIHKSHAENKGTSDKRAEKPCYISKKKYGRFEYRRNGRVLAVLPYFDTYKVNGVVKGFRYYAPKMGYQISTTPVELWRDGKRVGTVNPAFRFGTFR